MSIPKWLIVIAVSILTLCGTTYYSYKEYQKEVLDSISKMEDTVPMNLQLQRFSPINDIKLDISTLKLDDSTVIKSDTVKKKNYIENTYETETDDNRAIIHTKKKAKENNDCEIELSQEDLSYEIKKKKKKPKPDPGIKVAKLAEKLCTHEPLYNYVLGGRELSNEDGEGIDCAHFVGHVFREQGYDVKEGINDGNVQILRTTLDEYIAAEAEEDKPIKLQEMKPGDIIIFFNQGHDSHTGIYIGDDKIAHAANEEMGVTVTDMKYNEETGTAGYNNKQIQCIIRRAVEQEEEVKEDNSKNVVKTDVDITDYGDMDDVEISVYINEEKIEMYKPSKMLGTCDINTEKEIETDSGKIKVELFREGNNLVFTTTSDKDTELTVRPEIKSVKKDILLSSTGKESATQG